jgi:hypothetical protein
LKEKNINIANYDALLKEAKRQIEPQRLLFVFTRPELPESHSEIEAHRFFEGHGGTLTPIMYVDKTVADLSTFESLVDESQQMGEHWKIVFIAALEGKNGVLADSVETQSALEMMVKSIQQGKVSNFLACDRDGNAVSFS